MILHISLLGSAGVERDQLRLDQILRLHFKHNNLFLRIISILSIEDVVVTVQISTFATFK